MPLPKSLSTLRERPYRLLWTARSISAMGNALIPVTVVFAILRSGGGAPDVGTVLTCHAVGQVVMLPVGGVWADRLSRKQVLMATDAIQAVCHGLLAAMIFLHQAAVWQFAVTYTIAGMAMAFFTPASRAVLPELVGPEQLQPANALLGLTDSTTKVLGPALAALLLAVSSPGTAILVNAISFLLSFVLVSRMHLHRQVQRSEKQHFFADLRDGWQVVARRRWYLANLLCWGVWNFAIAFFFVLGPVVMEDGHGGATAWSVIMITGSAGSIVGGLAALRYRPRRPLVTTNAAAVLGILPLALLAPPAPLFAIALGVAAAFLMTSLVGEVLATTQQQLFPEEILARVSSLDWMISLIAMPAGYAAAAPVAQFLGTRTTLLVAAAVIGTPCLLLNLLPGVRSVQRFPDGTIGIAGERQTAAPLPEATSILPRTTSTETPGSPGR
ncbi:putative MFS family arabinose efflux permease [Streptomyces sp. Ag109_O5-1]|uniref:MFS transporter n=1 Tax=Streptomyces sp. Ag109_O5-1 TaxID=1938851 RepID=UPI000FAACB0D|nr:MFS transporter [Streptomyces sp. Ag109_O5-1]RPE37211.1 putative MFS family arabinose efflux permease [Streptomyces sp. Ag109_O5-1]